jgi:hypothetical protein
VQLELGPEKYAVQQFSNISRTHYNAILINFINPHYILAAPYANKWHSTFLLPL